MLLLLLLLALSSVSLQDTVKNRPLDENDHPLTPDLKERVPEIIANVSVSTVRRILPPTKSRHKRQVNSYVDVFDKNSKLRWENWLGYLPNGSVSIYNNYDDRIDYVCKVGCHSGFYNPRKGPFCHYPYYSKVIKDRSFEVLVNEDDFEILEWKKGSSGSVPEYSVRSCSSDEIYVGKNKYGLGKVYPKDKCFYLPWEGDEYWYKVSYEVLTTNMGVSRELISDVKYNIEQAKILKKPPKVLKRSTINNANCDPVSKTTTLSKTTLETNSWGLSVSLMIGVRATFETGIPFLAEGKLDITLEIMFQYSKGKSVTEESTHSVSFTINVPPNHRCTVKMMSYSYDTKIPFTARLKRTYRNGKTKSTTISGTYHGVHTADVYVEVERCEPLPNAKPCT
ncbi:natterin-3 [Kryptolebias marmoratus]|uniref:Natterin-3-like n=1 Tax=Kryptolebias marmoratus TaxID=37003 RepID=A0A3Q2ZKP3_KRYMA|nr:natterin-3 [Kryptolebias marmoratus]